MKLNLLIEVTDRSTGRSQKLCEMEVKVREGKGEMVQELEHASSLEWYGVDSEIQDAVRRAMRVAWGD